MIFKQLTNRENLWDLVVDNEGHKQKIYPLSLGKNVNRRKLAKANKNQSFKIFEV